MFLLDTNVCVQYLRGKNARVRQRLASWPTSDIYLCSIVLSELYYGWKGSHPRQERRSGFPSEVSLHCLNQPGEHVPLLPPKSFQHRQQPLDKSALR
jgi:predicted nucleic acid-binding protein